MKHPAYTDTELLDAIEAATKLGWKREARGKLRLTVRDGTIRLAFVNTPAEVVYHSVRSAAAELIRQSRAAQQAEIQPK